ncbi:MAG: tripartite tricarboxylate transporter TctB family protein [Candidatus Rokuibacteriota bacterium]
MRVADLITVVGLAAIGILVIVDSLRLGMGWGSDGPQSGFFPFWLAVLLLLSAGVIAAQTLSHPRGGPFVRREALGPVLKMALPAAAFVVLVQAIGLYVAAPLYMGVYMRWIGRHSWPATLLTGMAFSVITFVVFEKWFLVPMPKGPLETWLGY